MRTEKKTVLEWMENNAGRLSAFDKEIWNHAETAWREYRSAAAYVALLRGEGFEVEEGSAGMPTAFAARWTHGTGGPVLASFAEYDAVPANSQQAVPYPAPREGLHPWAAGHTDPHSALGSGALGGVLAAKAAMEKHGLAGTLVLMGEPAEKVCGSKPVHAAHGYYDDFDGAVCYHPAFGATMSNTTVWDIHSGCCWSRVYTFECRPAEDWSSGAAGREATAHTMARAPGANDALCLMYTTTKYSKEAMLPRSGTWTLNEAILAGGQATSDNLPPKFAQLQYTYRSPTIAMQQRITEVLDLNARQVAGATHCRAYGRWVTKTRPGLPNRAMARLAFDNIVEMGPPEIDEEGRAFGREIQKNLGLEPMAEPIAPDLWTVSAPWDACEKIRELLPGWQKNYTSDDYTDWTWHTPAARIYIGRARMAPPEPGYRYPDWTWNAIGGYGPLIDQTIFAAARAIAGTLVDLLCEPAHLEAARAEFEERTGGGVGGSDWIAPLLPGDFQAPVDLRWPEYVDTVRGREWWLPTPLEGNGAGEEL